jgi:hypothetical protein
MDDPFSKILAEQELFRRAMALSDPTDQMSSHTSELMHIHDLARRAADDALRMSGLMDRQRRSDFDGRGLTSLLNEPQSQAKFLSGALDEYRHLKELGIASEFQTAIDRAQARQTLYDHSFRTTRSDEVARLATSLQQANLAMPQYPTLLDATQTAMLRMQSTWINANNVDASVRAFAEIQAIGIRITQQQPFDEGLGIFLRRGLGDWRGVTPETLPVNITDNPIARSDFYVSLGFDPGLTDLPQAAFRESARLAGLSNREDEDDAELCGLARNERVYGELLPFEIQVRGFITKVMTDKFGPDWMEGHLPDEMLKVWKDKKERAKQKGEDRPLVEYADFTDYIRIIELKDNWRNVFEAIFGRQSDIQESFVRLFPVRLCAMHARIITLDDELFMMSETRRILRAIQSFC